MEGTTAVAVVSVGVVVVVAAAAAAGARVWQTVMVKGCRGRECSPYPVDWSAEGPRLVAVIETQIGSKPDFVAMILVAACSAGRGVLSRMGCMMAAPRVAAGTAKQ